MPIRLEPCKALPDNLARLQKPVCHLWVAGSMPMGGPMYLTLGLSFSQYPWAVLVSMSKGTVFSFVLLQEAWDTPDDAEAGGELKDAASSLSQYSDRLGGAWWQTFAEVCHCSLYAHLNVYLAVVIVMLPWTLIRRCTNIIAVRTPSAWHSSLLLLSSAQAAC